MELASGGQSISVDFDVKWNGPEVTVSFNAVKASAAPETEIFITAKHAWESGVRRKTKLRLTPNPEKLMSETSTRSVLVYIDSPPGKVVYIDSLESKTVSAVEPKAVSAVEPKTVTEVDETTDGTVDASAIMTAVFVLDGVAAVGPFLAACLLYWRLKRLIRQGGSTFRQNIMTTLALVTSSITTEDADTTNDVTPKTDRVVSGQPMVYFMP